MRTLYLVLAVAGAVVPYLFFARFLGSPDATLGNFVAQLFATAPAGGFTSDLLITSGAFWVWSLGEARSLGMRRWWSYVVVNLLVGLSCAFPLFLWAREGARLTSRSASPAGPSSPPR